MTIGLESWFFNFTQFTRWGNSPESLADIPRPLLEYALWGLFKGGEVASVIGGCVAHPLYRLYLTKRLTPEKTTPNSHKIIRNSCRKLQGRFLLAGLVAGPILTTLHGTRMTTSEVRERCYKIRCDTESMTIDRCGLMLGLIGWYWKRFQGAVDGINIGIAYALFNNKVLSSFTSPMLKDKVRPEERYATAEDAKLGTTQLTRFLSEMEQTHPSTATSRSS